MMIDFMVVFVIGEFALSRFSVEARDLDDSMDIFVWSKYLVAGIGKNLFRRAQRAVPIYNEGTTSGQKLMQMRRGLKNDAYLVLKACG